MSSNDDVKCSTLKKINDFNNFTLFLKWILHFCTLVLISYISSICFSPLILIFTLIFSFLSATFGCCFKRPTLFIIWSSICFSCSKEPVFEPVRIFNPTLTLIRRDWDWMATLANIKKTNKLEIEILILLQENFRKMRLSNSVSFLEGVHFVV